LDLLTLWLSEKYRVFSYGCAGEALTALESVKPNLLVLDIGMRDIDGVECLKAIRAIPGYGSIPAIALTGYARDCERAVFQAAGFQAVLTKPILDDALFATITGMLASLGDQRSESSAVTTAA
jgi:CheY-like chemotaxis protein